MESTVAPQIPVFRPTMEEIKCFPSFLKYMESLMVHKLGLVKIIPPPEWIARKSRNYDGVDTYIPCPILQEVTGIGGVYTVLNCERPGLSVKEFEELAKSEKYAPPPNLNHADLERYFWKNFPYIPAIYGADVSGSLYNVDQPCININNLGTIFDCISDVKIEGVNTAYLYFGMWKSAFAWHVEDMDLYSINYLHYGAPKTWYVVAPEHGRRLERVAEMYFPGEAKSCPAFLRHKKCMINPSILRRNGVPVNKITQEAGEFIITFPYAYHAGFNHGYNCAESTNFASERWIEYGKRAKRCHCFLDTVQIEMDCFVEKFQPEKFEAWLKDEDLAPHPEDDQRKLVSRSASGASKGLTGQPSKRHPHHKRFNAQEEKKRKRSTDTPESVVKRPPRRHRGVPAASCKKKMKNEGRVEQPDNKEMLKEVLPDVFGMPLAERVKLRRMQSDFSESNSSNSSQERIPKKEKKPKISKKVTETLKDEAVLNFVVHQSRVESAAEARNQRRMARLKREQEREEREKVGEILAGISGCKTRRKGNSPAKIAELEVKTDAAKDCESDCDDMPQLLIEDSSKSDDDLDTTILFQENCEDVDDVPVLERCSGDRQISAACGVNIPSSAPDSARASQEDATMSSQRGSFVDDVPDLEKFSVEQPITSSVKTVSALFDVPSAVSSGSAPQPSFVSTFSSVSYQAWQPTASRSQDFDSFSGQAPGSFLPMEIVEPRVSPMPMLADPHGMPMLSTPYEGQLSYSSPFNVSSASLHPIMPTLERNASHPQPFRNDESTSSMPQRSSRRKNNQT